MTAAAGTQRGVWARRGDAALRFVAAVPVGYAVASLWAMALARIIPGDRAEATVWATLAAFALCCAAVMYAYAARSGVRALGLLLALAGIAAAIAWLSIGAGGRI